MNRFEFRQAKAEDIPVYVDELFAILAGNMREIQPTGNTYEEDYKIWLDCAVPVMCEGKNTMILIFCEDNLCGYFRYSVKDKTFRMDDIQFKKEFQGSGLFAALYRYLITIIPGDTEYVDAYSGKNNIKSQEILKHLGLTAVGENKNGRSYYFKGEYKKLLERYSE